ncbi:MFS transporter [Aquibacillus halophilus]|uniref:MFS transporter n=1 Tax=Aquibacillus halophilus TaxID=930132 RepID=A0A6A8DF14_9BACI|nr:MFS transporter [Aquibacillus halophilus]MRH44243.1 MFS transporter [Aquibacillus halophilus]
MENLNLTKKSILLPYLIVFTGFLVFGFSENVRGPAIPRIQSEFAIDELQVGILLALNSFGYLLACSFTGVLTTKLGIKLTCLLAFGSIAISGVFIYFSNSYFTFSFSYFYMYIGNGMLEIGLAILAARIFTKNTGFMMNLSHFFYGLGSTVAPLLATGLMGWHVYGGGELGWRGMYVVILSLAIIPMIPTIVAKLPGNSISAEDRMPLKVYVRDPIAWLIVGILSLGVTAELSMGGWLVNFLEKSYDWSSTASASMLSVFFFCFMLSRLILGFITDKIGFLISLIIFSGVAGFSVIAAIVIGPSAVFLFALAGVGIAPIYPTVMALIAKRYPNGSDTAITFTVTMMGIVVVVANFLVGAIIDLFRHWFTNFSGEEIGLIRGYQAGFIFIGLCAIFCSLISVILYRRLQKVNQIL